MGITSNLNVWLIVYFSDWWSSHNRFFYSIVGYIMTKTFWGEVHVDPVRIPVFRHLESTKTIHFP